MTDSGRASWMIGEGKSLPPEFDDGVVWAAWLYYVDQLTQSDIAKILGMSRATIVNYLQEARERGSFRSASTPTSAGALQLRESSKRLSGLKARWSFPQASRARWSRGSAKQARACLRIW